MKKAILTHRYKNGKSITVGTCAKEEGVPACDTFYLAFKTPRGKDVFYLRPDEVVLISSMLSRLVLKRTDAYTVNTMRKKCKRDY